MSNSSLLDRFAAFDSAAVSDALDQLGLPAGVGGIRPVWGPAAVVGFAVTVGLEPRTEGPSGAHIATTAVESSDDQSRRRQPGPHRRVVLGRHPEPGRVHSWCSRRRCRRRVPRCGRGPRAGFPGVLAGFDPGHGQGRLQQRSTGEPVGIAGLTVEQGDVVVADETGLAFVPRGRAEEVVRIATAIVARERAIADEVRSGAPVSRAMPDARLAGEKESVR